MRYMINTTLNNVARMSKFQRGAVLAQSLKHQKKCLAMARNLIKKGQSKLAQQWIDEWKAQRQAFNMASAWQ